MSAAEIVSGNEATAPLWQAPPERRSATRFAMGLLPGCRLLCGEPPLLVEARIADLAASGVGLVLGCPLEPRSLVAVHLASGPFLSARAITARVAYCVPLDDGSFLSGVEFVRRLAGDELRVLLS
jgi:hypothetical protein